MQYVFQAYCAAFGIIYHTTCAHIIQQNGIEHKNHHLVEIARTIMIHMHIPKHF